MTINEEQLAFYWRLGLAITQWAHVEHSLGRVLGVAEQGSPQRMQLFQELSRSGAFRKQVELVNEAFSQRDDSEKYLAGWNPIRQRLERNYLKRNKLAHRTVVNYPSETVGRRIALVDWATFPFSGASSPPNDAICVRDIVGFTNAFSALHRTLENFGSAIVGRPQPYPKELENPSEPLELDEILREVTCLSKTAADGEQGSR